MGRFDWARIGLVTALTGVLMFMLIAGTINPANKPTTFELGTIVGAILALLGLRVGLEFLNTLAANVGARRNCATPGCVRADGHDGDHIFDPRQTANGHDA